jgi:YVTN family beta-propeller protein
MAPVRLVREDLGIVDLLAIATQRRPDLQGIKYAAAAATAATKSTLWGGVSPQLQAGYQFGRLSSETPGQTFPLQEQQHGNASVGWLLSPTVFGQVKTAKATEQDAALEVERRFEQVRAQVVRSAQDSATNAKLIPIAKQQEAAAEEALRLAQRNLGAGTALTVDVLQAEDALNEAQLRYADAATAYNKSQVNLLAALGLIDSVSLTPGASPDAPAPALQLQSIADIPLGGHPTRFDYASLDAGRHLLFIAHLGDSEVIVFDTEARRVVKRIANVSHVHGVLAIPELGRVYASATGTNEVVAIDDKTLQIIARMPGGTYPDGLAYSPETRKVYVSDEHGGTDTVLDVVTNKRVATVPIGGVIGNTQYDDSSHHMFISAQSDNQLVEVDPQTDMIVRRVLVPGAQENHGLLIDSASHRAFVACQGNDQLIVIDLRTGAAIAQFPVAKDPDVLAFDASRQTLYVAGESGQVSEFKVSDGKISKTGESLLARNAHVVAIHPMTHEIYFPIMDVDGKPVLRIMRGGG